ncbi:hypothetical protein STSP_05550 [Streptomyces jeddahensis]|uniref:DUF2293 domain-containing protein n=1 Tax=Streptomyces jeddahensis TaxID=1716141 RepID=A0A177HYS6_9ACTN|nr:DUF2293 domain-containing protein [Streptomyces jeddahensis]OAH16032.1 hypothetical protein STSP_05550 [Streptomyces jeddahensis]
MATSPTASGPGGPLVFQSVKRRRHCAECRGGPLSLLVLEGGAPRCLDCADLGHLVFLPRGDTALTRRAREGSALSAVVVRFNRRQGRYERQGVLVEEDALARAEERCLADAEVRARRRARDAKRREAEDVRFTAEFAEAICRLFPGCPPDRARAIAAHASVRGSGRVGRSAAGRALSETAVTAAVAAAIRHLDTPYDGLLMSGVPRQEARRRIGPTVEATLRTWRAGTDTSTGPDTDADTGTATATGTATDTGPADGHGHGHGHSEECGHSQECGDQGVWELT